MKCLWEFHVDCGRMGELHGRFLATEKEVKDAMGKEYYFDDVLGKHSCVTSEITEENVKLVTDDVHFLTLANELGINLCTGLNPLEAIE